MFRLACAIILTLIVLIVAGCGGGGGGTTPPIDPGTHDITVAVTPSAITIQANEQYQFGAYASGGTNPAVLWTVTDEVDGGMVSNTGLYTAPSTDGRTCHVRATSVEDPTKYVEAIVTIEGIGEVNPGNNGVEVHVSPSQVFLPSSTQAQFTATVYGHSNTAVTWSLDESNSGSIAQDGTYTAPSNGCRVTIRATSQADPAKSDTATVFVIPGGLPPMPPGG